MQFSFAINSEPVDQALDSFANSLADNSSALRLVADDFREMVTEQFSSQGTAGGTPWAELSPATKRRRRASSGTLNSTGALLASLIDVGGGGHVEVTDEQSLIMGTDLPYAMYQQTGTGRGFGQTNISSGRGLLGRGMPMRPLLILSDDRAGRWVDMLGQGLAEKSLVLGGRELGGITKG